MREMRTPGRRSFALIMALVLSAALHVAAIAGIRGFGLPAFVTPDVFITTLERESAPKAVVKGTLLPALQENLETREAVKEEGSIKEEPKEAAAETAEPEIPAVVQEASDVVSEKKPAPEEPAGAAETGEKPEVLAQQTPKPEPEEKTARTPMAFRERLNFDIYWIGIYVGKASLEAIIRDHSVTITSEAHSASFISNFYKVEDYSESRIENGRPVSFKIRQREGRYRSNKETAFDAQNNRVTYFDHLKGIRNEHDLTVPGVWDVVSGFYHLRTLPLEVGGQLSIDVFDSNKFLSVEVSVLGRERVEMPGKGEVDAIIVKPVLKSEGLFQKKGDILIWLTDDGSRIPVKIETEVPVGKVVAQLKGIEAGALTVEPAAKKTARPAEVLALSGSAVAAFTEP